MRRAGLWDHQGRHGVSPISDPGTGERPQRMDAGVPGMESEAHGRIASVA